MASAITTRPVVAQVYGWQSGDTIAAVVDADDTAPFAIANIISETVGSVMFRRGRLDNKSANAGFKFELTATISLCSIEVANTGAFTGEDITWQIDDATTFAAADQISTSAWPQLPLDIWTGYTGLVRSKPVRSNILLGYDNFTTGPSPATPPTVATVTCGSGQILFSTPAAARAKWEAAYIALGINGHTLPGLPYSSISVTPINLRSPAGGMGYKYSLTWQFLSTADTSYLDGLWEVSAHGNFPIFLFPVPGQRSITGVITGTDQREALRGGLMRLLSWTRTEAVDLADGWQATGGKLVAETWEEVRNS